MGQGNATHLCNTPYQGRDSPDGPHLQIQCALHPACLPSTWFSFGDRLPKCTRLTAPSWGCHPPSWAVVVAYCVHRKKSDLKATSELTGLKWIILKKTFCPPLSTHTPPLVARESRFLCWQWTQRGVNEDFLCNPAINWVKDPTTHFTQAIRVTLFCHLWHREVIQAEILHFIKLEKCKCSWQQSYNTPLTSELKVILCSQGTSMLSQVPLLTENQGSPNLKPYSSEYGKQRLILVLRPSVKRHDASLGKVASTQPRFPWSLSDSCNTAPVKVNVQRTGKLILCNLKLISTRGLDRTGEMHGPFAGCLHRGAFISFMTLRDPVDKKWLQQLIFKVLLKITEPSKETGPWLQND